MHLAVLVQKTQLLDHLHNGMERLHRTCHVLRMRHEKRHWLLVLAEVYCNLVRLSCRLHLFVRGPVHLCAAIFPGS